MAVLAIRAHKRFGVSRGVRVHRESGSALGGLLIELSLEGCRISNLNSALFAVEDCVEIEIEGCPSLHGCIRWNHGGMIGLRLTQPLHHAELIELIGACRNEPAMVEARRA